MSKILYHSLERSSADVSPFDEAILLVAAQANLRIVSPYIGISYLERIIERAETWLLVSDIEAWLSSLSVRARPRAWSFIRTNLDRIHHCQGIHAKAVIGVASAMLGSANLTDAGILSRTELGIFLDDSEQVSELQRWFDGLWLQTPSPIVDETNAFIAWLDDEASRNISRRQKFALASDTRKVRAKLIRVEPRREASPDVGLSLASVAQDIVSRDDQHYTSLDNALEQALDILAPNGFTLGAAVIEVRRRTTSAAIREVYFLLLQHCANHARSVFVDATVNRLILTEGRFMQSDKSRLEDALRKFDLYLLKLIQELRFDTPRDLPRESDIEAETGISERDQLVLIDELMDAGFLTLHDLPGQLPLYELSGDFDWTGRFHFFHRAKTAWSALFEKQRPVEQARKQEGADLDDLDDETPSYFEEQKTLRKAKAEEARRLALKAEIAANSNIASGGSTRRSVGPLAAPLRISIDRTLGPTTDEASVRLIEWLLTSPSGHRGLPGKKPSKFLAKELGLSPLQAGRLVFGNPVTLFVSTSGVDSDGEYIIRLKRIQEKFVSPSCPLTRAALERNNLLITDTTADQLVADVGG